MGKKRLTRRDFLRMSTLTAGAAALAGCAPRVVTEEVEKEVTREVEKELVVTGTPGPRPEPVEIEFMNWWGGSREPLMDQVIWRFTNEYPHITVNNAVQPWDARAERAATSIASGNPPALVMVPRREVYKFAYEGLIIPIDDYVEAAGLDLYEIFYAGEIESQMWGDKLWSFPMPTAGGNESFYVYNKELLADAGFDPESPPETWEEMAAVAEACLVADDVGIKVMGADVDQSVGSFATHLYSNNGAYISEDAREILFNSDEGVEALEWMVYLTNEINGGIERVNDFWAADDDTSPDYPFYTDTIAILYEPPSIFGQLSAVDPEMYEDPSKWGVALRPYNGDNPDAEHKGASGLSWAWGQVIPKGLEQGVQDAAYQFLEFLGTDPAGGCTFLYEQNRPSPVKACNENPGYYGENPYWDKVLEGFEHVVSVPITPVEAEVQDVLGLALEEAFYEVKTPKEALDEAAETCQGILDEFWSA